jgi:hypothetical protein
MAYYGKGTSGQVLTDQIAPTMSEWTSISTPLANSALSLFDDFISTISNVYGNIGFNTVTGGTASFTLCSSGVSNAHPGTVVFSVGAAYSTAGLFLAQGTYAPYLPFILGGGILSVNFVMKLNQLSSGTNRFDVQLGMSDTFNLNDPANGVYFRYTDNVNSGKWQICTAAGSTLTATNTTVVADTNYHNFGFIINAAASSISYTIDGVSVGTVTTNIPTNPITASVVLVNTGTYTSGNQSIDVDLFYMTLALTTAR